MRIQIALPLAAILLASLFATPAYASPAVYLYSPTPNKTWNYVCQTQNPCTYDHRDDWQNNSIARDIADSSWSTSDPVAFTLSSAANVYGKVVAANVNCPTGGPDNYVMVEIYGDGLYYGRVDYVHLRSLSVSVNQIIYSGTTLGYPQTTASYYNGKTCWYGQHVHLGTSYYGWTAGSGGSYSTYLLTFPQGIGMTPILRAKLDAENTAPHTPVTQ